MRLSSSRVGIGHQNLHQEAVELRFGQRIGAFHFDRVLRGHHQERRSSSWVVVPLVTVRSCMASSSADCVLGVARLISSASTRLAKIGPGWKRSVLCAAVVGLHDHAADDVGGHQVGRELDARIAQLKCARQRAQQRGLAQSGNAFEQHVAAGEQADQHAFDDVVWPTMTLAISSRTRFRSLVARSIKAASAVSV